MGEDRGGEGVVEGAGGGRLNAGGLALDLDVHGVAGELGDPGQGRLLVAGQGPQVEAPGGQAGHDVRLVPGGQAGRVGEGADGGAGEAAGGAEGVEEGVDLSRVLAVEGQAGEVGDAGE